jgi:hypothetical protein
VVFEVSAPLTYIEFVMQKPADGNRPLATQFTMGTVRSGQVTESCKWDRFVQAKAGLPAVTVEINRGANLFTTEEPVGVLYNAVARTTTTFKDGVVVSTSGLQSDAPCTICFNVKCRAPDGILCTSCTVRATAKPPPSSYAAFE